MRKSHQRILKFLAILGFIQLSFLMKAQVVPNIDWVQHYVFRDSVDNNSSAIDADNNVYVTGYGFNNFDKDLIVLKYDSLGNLLWSDVYDNGGDDEGVGIKVDASGNVYVAATSYDGTSGLDIVTRVYDASGSLLMHDRYDAGSNATDVAADIEINKINGDFWVIGSSFVSFDFNVTVLKYKTGFSLDWSNNYNSGNDDTGVGLSLTSNNDAYCTARMYNGVDADVWTFMVDQAGSKYGWDNYVAISGGDDEPQEIITTGSDAVICGKIWDGANSTWDAFTRRIDGSGSTVWHQDYDSVDVMNFHTSLIRDSIGNIGVTGLALGASGWEYHTLMYDSTGVFLWPQANKEQTNLWGALVEPRISVDTVAHHFYVSGAKQNSTSDVMVYQISPFSGSTKWKQYYDGPLNGADYGTGITVSGLGIIYLSANCENSVPGFNQTTIRLSQTPVYPPIDPLSELPNDRMTYIENKGQIIDNNNGSVDAGVVQYYTEGTQPNFFFKNNAFSFVYAKYDTVAATIDSLCKVSVAFKKSNPYSSLHPFTQLENMRNYFIDSIPNGAVTDVKSYRYLAIPNVYHLIDLIYYSNNDGIKYYFVVKPGGNPADITHNFTGADSTTTNGDSLKIHTRLGTLKLERPYVYDVGYVANNYVLTPITAWNADWVSTSEPDTYTFNIGAYTPTKVLVFEIDQGNTTISTSPAADNLVWNTYIGGSKLENYIDLEVDSLGNVYGLMETESKDFYTIPNSYIGTSLDGVKGALIHKFSKTGTVKRTTYVGVSGGLIPRAITTLRDSSVVLIGMANNSLSVPPTFVNPINSYSTNFSTLTAFIIKFNSNMNTVQWSTRYPGRVSDVDRNGYDDIYILSQHNGSSAPLFNKTNALNMTSISGAICNSIARFDMNGVQSWGSFIPSYAINNYNYIKVDRKRNNYYVFGQTADTTDFKHFNHYNTFYQPVKKSNRDAFIQKFTSGDTIKVSTMYGGNDDDILTAAEILANGDLAIVGFNSSNDYSSYSFNPGNGSFFHVSGSAPTYAKGWINKFDSIMHRTWAITHGDSAKDTKLYSITKDIYNNIYMSGYGTGMGTASYLPGAYYQSTGSTGSAVFINFDAINQVQWITFMGPTIFQQSNTRVVYNPVNNNLFFAGWSASLSGNNYPFRNFTSPQAYWQPTLYNFGNYDGFVGRFNLTGVVGIKDVSNNKTVNNSLYIYPNPSRGTVTISLDYDLKKPYQLLVYNNLGSVVYSEYVKSSFDKTKTIDLCKLSIGIYYINVFSPEINKTAKLIKE